MIAQKRGNAGAATLITVITILIIMYLAFLPSPERQDILKSKTGSTSSTVEKTLLDVIPGEITAVPSKIRSHDLPEIRLLAKTEGTLLDEFNNAYIKNAIFTNIKEVLTFEIKDLENTDNVLLNFIVKDTEGVMNILVNDEEVFSGKLSKGNIQPIPIKKRLLKNQNIIEFQGESPGVLIWKISEHEISNIMITADQTNPAGLTSTQTFIADSEESTNFDRGTLKFIPECNVRSVGKLTVKFNDQLIYDSIPDCGIIVNQDVQFLNKGENKVEFSTTEGQYLIDRLTYQSTLKKESQPVYNFNIDKLSDVQNKVVNLTMNFLDTSEQREGQLVVNDQTLFFNTKKQIFTEDISSLLKQGNNFIKINPSSSFYLAELKVEVID